MKTSNYTVEIKNVHKTFDDIVAVNNVSFSTEKGEIFGIIGPDGAGKTTLFRLIATLLLPDSGTINVLGYDAIRDFKKIRCEIGYMPGKFSLYQDLTVEENLNFFATIFGGTVKENYELIKDIYQHIEPFKTRPAGKLSGGMKQKLALSCALIHKPKVLLLDEPTTGVDAVSRKEFWDMLHKLKEHGLTIIVSTPYMDEAARCTRIALMQKGQIMQTNTPENILTLSKQKTFSISTNNPYELLLNLRKHQNVNSALLFGKEIHFTLSANYENLNELRQYLEKSNENENILIEEITPTIEDIFISLMTETENA